MSEVEGSKGSRLDYSNKALKRNSMLSVVYKIAGIGLSFISAPLILHVLGEEKYGVWASMLSLVSWVYYFDLGIGNGLRNKLTEALARDEEEEARKYTATAYRVIAIISLIIFVVLLLLVKVVNIADLFNIRMDDEDVNICLIAAGGLACINFIISLANNILFAFQRASLVSLFSVVAQLFYVIALALCYVFKIRLLFVIAIAEGLSQFIKNAIETIWVFRKNKYLRFSRNDYDVRYIKSIASFGIQMFIVQIAALVLNSTDNLIITKYFGAADVTPYNFCFKFFNVINTFYVVIITPLLSAYTAAYATRQYQKVFSMLKKNIELYILFFSGTVLAAFIFKPFAHIWLQKDLDYQHGIILWTVLYIILLMFSHIFSTFLTGISQIKETTIGTVFGTIVNIPVSIFLAVNMKMGTAGVVLGSVVSLLVGNWIGPVKTAIVIRNMKREMKQKDAS